MGLNDEVVERFLADSEKRGAIFGTLLGDATITHIPPGKYGGEGKTYRASKCGPEGTTYLRVKHAADQKDLVLHKHEFMKEIAGKVFMAKPPADKPHWQDAYGFYTKKSTAWLKLFDLFYHDARITTSAKGRIQKFKRINREILDQVTNRGLAWWVMDDGCYSYNSEGYGFFRMSTQGYTEEENELICAWLKDKYNVKASLNRDKCKGVKLSTYNSFVIYIGAQEFETLKPIIDPYIIPALKFKLGYSEQLV